MEDINKDEAIRCKQIGEQALKAGDKDRALKFLNKSKSMYSPLTSEVDAIINSIKNQSHNNSNDNNNNNASHSTKSDSSKSHPTASSSTSAHHASSTAKSYTKEQHEEVIKIKKCKTHYEVLGIEKTASEEEIKKAYKKIAFRLHPDKNSAPGAEEAFKKVGAAFACLRDKERRAAYDQYGSDTPQTSSGFRPGRSGTYATYGNGFQQFSDEDFYDLFASVFGAGFAHPDFQMRTRYTQAQYPRRPQQERARAKENPLAPLRNLLPLLLLLLVSLMNFGGSHEPPVFAFQKSLQYPIERTTQTANLPYYVNNAFEVDYSQDSRKLWEVEKQVLQYYAQHLRRECEREVWKQNTAIERAQRLTGDQKEVKLKQANELKKPSCEKLQEIYSVAA